MDTAWKSDRSCTEIVWWEECEEFFNLANLDASKIIEMQCSNGRSADRRLTDKVITVPTKMHLPIVRAWMKQRHLIASIRIEGFNAVSLVQVATRTGPCEIVQLRMSTARLWDHMLDVECGALE
jgi:hypothetical protein